MEGLKKFIRDIGSAPVGSLFNAAAPALPEAARMMFELSGNAAFVTDTEGQIVYINPIAERFAGIKGPDALGRPLRKIVLLLNPKTSEAMDVPLQKVLVEARAMFLPEYTTLTNPGGQKLPVDGSLGPIFARDGRVLGTVLLLHDVSRYRLLTDTLSLQANQDPLTGLVNRREFETRVSRTIRTARMHKSSHALAYLDLDKFKIVNDVCGHGAGDELLRRIAGALRSKVRERDTLARLGGDEFGLLLENCTIEAALQVCNNLLDVVKEIRFSWQERTFTVGVSIGLSVIDEKTEDIGSALAATDAACYRAKENGRSRIEVLNQKSKETPPGQQASAIARIVSALDENRFILYAQPIVPVATPERVELFEILAKMVGAKGEHIAPADFLPAAERYQLLPTLDRWVIRHAFETYAKVYSGKESDPHPIWSINISAASLSSEGFTAFIRDEAKRHAIAPAAICFEINESVALADNGRAADFIWALKIDGFRFCVDDFGESLGVLGPLKNLPIDFIKIHGSLIKEMPADNVSRGIVEAIHHIGRIMGVKTIAGCIESPELFGAVRAAGIDYAQGYACGRPGPIEDLKFHPVPRLPEIGFPVPG